MLEIDGRQPRLNNQLCEALFCQQYWENGKLAREVDTLLIRVNGHWHQLYFDAGIVYWRTMHEAPKSLEPQSDTPFAYPLIDLVAKYDLQDGLITDCSTEPLIDGARVTFEFKGEGTLFITHSENRTRLQFNRA